MGGGLVGDLSVLTISLNLNFKQVFKNWLEWRRIDGMGLAEDLWTSSRSREKTAWCGERAVKGCLGAWKGGGACGWMVGEGRGDREQLPVVSWWPVTPELQYILVGLYNICTASSMLEIHTVYIYTWHWTVLTGGDLLVTGCYTIPTPPIFPSPSPTPGPVQWSYLFINVFHIISLIQMQNHYFKFVNAKYILICWVIIM